MLFGVVSGLLSCAYYIRCYFEVWDNTFLEGPGKIIVIGGIAVLGLCFALTAIFLLSVLLTEKVRKI